MQVQDSTRWIKGLPPKWIVVVKITEQGNMEGLSKMEASVNTGGYTEVRCPLSTVSVKSGVQKGQKDS